MLPFREINSSRSTNHTPEIGIGSEGESSASTSTSLRNGFRRSMYNLDSSTNEYLRRNTGHTSITDQLLSGDRSRLPNETRTLGYNLLLNAMADFIKDPEIINSIPENQKEFDYVQQHFHHSKYFESLNQEAKNFFLNKIHVADSDVILDAMADFIKDPEIVNSIPRDQEFEYARQYFHHSKYFESLTQKERHFFLNEIQMTNSSRLEGEDNSNLYRSMNPDQDRDSAKSLEQPNHPHETYYPVGNNTTTEIVDEETFSNREIQDIPNENLHLDIQTEMQPILRLIDDQLRENALKDKLRTMLSDRLVAIRNLIHETQNDPVKLMRIAANLYGTNRNLYGTIQTEMQPILRLIDDQLHENALKDKLRTMPSDRLVAIRNLIHETQNDPVKLMRIAANLRKINED